MVSEYQWEIIFPHVDSYFGVLWMLEIAGWDECNPLWIDAMIDRYCASEIEDVRSVR